jgi:hypothetical protein
VVLNNEYLLPRRFNNDNVYTYNQFDYACAILTISMCLSLFKRGPGVDYKSMIS